MRQHFERVCIGALVLHIIFSLICFGISAWTKSSAVYSAAWLFAFGTVFWLLTYIHTWAIRTAQEEEREEREFEKRRGASETGKLFEDRKEEDAFSARTKLNRIERWLFPALTILLSLGMMFVSYLLITGLMGAFGTAGLRKQPDSLPFLGVIALVSFILSRYTAGLSDEAQSQSLRGSAGAMFSGTLAVFLIAISFILSYYGYQLMERVMLYLTSALIGIIGVELALNFIMHFYRPRVKGRVVVPVYYSRILGLIAAPRSIFRATAMTLDYQFGFKVSETWFYQFVERAAAPLILFLLLTLYMFSSMIIVQADEEVIIERFGRPLENTLKPGFHFKRPWPFDKAYRFKKTAIRQKIVGVRPKEEPGNILLWTIAHNEEELPFIIPQSDPGGVTMRGDIDPAVAVNYVTIEVRLQYRIDDVFKYAYSKSDPERLLDELAHRELVKATSTADYNRFMGEDRADAEASMAKNLRDAVERKNIGIDLVSLHIIGVHPPIETVKEFEEVVAALEEKEAKVWEAKGYANEVLNRVAGMGRQNLMRGVREYDEAIRAREKAILEEDQTALEIAQEAVTEAETILGNLLMQAGGSVAEELKSADSSSYGLETLTKADAESFVTQAEAFRINPDIYKLRFRLQTLAESIVNSRIYIVPGEMEGREVLILDLEDKTPSALDVYTLPEENK